MNNISNQNIEENVNAIDYSFINFIHSETQSVGNNIIWISTIIILLCTNIISLSEIEINGLKMDIKKEYISYILFTINVYYFLRFYNLLNYDNLNFRMPKEINLIITESKEKIKHYSSTITQHTDNITRLENEADNLSNENIDPDIKSVKLESLKNEILDLKNSMTEDFNSVKYFLDLIEKTKAKLLIGNKYLKNNNLINNYFPKLIFSASFFTILWSLYRLVFY
ncbi:hypothetical protein QFZ37_001717 [Chryseobacterium ginsenosidimutans]|uniref:hypothetical protein n=1 Tax=Chryseobacterium ginsenosidimutans TaxID=687846 RepID=UPI002780AE5F|nr:hypothetical protein [Chryseobacterium ginsenosidimutans]MDQ0593348.1 hypothetical protein [Chryseobacterium ginsenosidimutans]